MNFFDHRLSLFALLSLALVACGGDGPSTPREPILPTPPATAGSVASVRVTANMSALMAGMHTTVVAAPLDAGGSTLIGRTVTWSSESQAVATVTDQGAVQAVGPGSTAIVATVDGKQGRVPLTVVARPECADEAITLAVGEVRVLGGAQRSSVCVTGGTYSLVVLSTDPAASARRQVEVSGAGLLSAPSFALLDVAGFGLGNEPAVPRGDLAAHIRSLEFERSQIAARSSLAALDAPHRVMAATAALAVGDTLSLYTNPIPNDPNACTQRPLVLGRVMAVGSHAIVVADVANPVGGYTTAEYQTIATEFDTKVYPTDSAYFAPAWYHENSPARPPIVLFFTREVNRRTAVGSASSTVAFVFPLDVLGSPSTCARSNYNLGCPEVLHVRVPDPGGTVNGRVLARADARLGLIGTLAHELQHVVNLEQAALKRGALEETWLNEGLSTIAEELLFYKLSGWSAKGGITRPMLEQNPTAMEAYRNSITIEIDNLRSYLRSPETNAFHSNAAPVETYGAAWQFLRFAADRGSIAETRLWQDVVTARTTGLRTIYATFGDSVQLRRDFAVAQVLSDARLPMVPAAQRFVSWDFRTFYSSPYPLSTRPVIGGAPLTLSLASGGTAYLQLDVVTGGIGAAKVASQAQVPLADLDLLLVRTR